MFTPYAEDIVRLAKRCAVAAGRKELDVPALVRAVSQRGRAGALLAECLGLTRDSLRALNGSVPEPAEEAGSLPLGQGVRQVLQTALQLAERVPDTNFPQRVAVRHLVAALAGSPEIAPLLGANPLPQGAFVPLVSSWYEADAAGSPLGQLADRVDSLRDTLRARVFGQDQAILALEDALFNAEVVAEADTERAAPQAVLVFVGPPGVGKTMLAREAAAHIGRPFKRFDMSAYSAAWSGDQLIGSAKTFKEAAAGQLTGFVDKHPNAILLFDEIEKAHLATIQLFLQILDAGTLEDKFLERQVKFRDTIIIFTTNAGRQLYDDPNASGVHRGNSRFHRQTVLDALAAERDKFGDPVFPGAICSRLATGYPILFNHLGVPELERVVRTELERVARLFEQRHYVRVAIEDPVPLCLVLREGARADARTLRAQAENWIKTEFKNLVRLYDADQLDEVLWKVDEICFALDDVFRDDEQEIRQQLDPPAQPGVLLVADPSLAQPFRAAAPNVRWKTAASEIELGAALQADDIDFVLLDLRLGSRDTAAQPSLHDTYLGFSRAPASSRALEKGQRVLRRLRELDPDLPAFLLREGEAEGSEPGDDDEALLASVRAGGAAGIFSFGLKPGGAATPEAEREAAARLAEDLQTLAVRRYRQRNAQSLGQQRKVLAFDTAPKHPSGSRTITVRLRNLRLSRAIAAADAGEVIDDIDRPTDTFEEVIGAEAAKEELRMFIEYLRNPRAFLQRYRLDPPKGVLLHGPPGTGKTKLARAMAGESDVAFLQANASSFAQIYVGTGPKAVRELFERARRNAPAVVFIDEIDAIGRVRGTTSNTEAENTLNALLSELDGFVSPSPSRPVFVLAATNFEIDGENGNRTLDPALVRRFTRTILVDLPDRAARELFLTRRLAEYAEVGEKIIKLLAERSSGMSIANLEGLVETAARAAIRRGESLNSKHLEEAFEEVQFGASRPRSEPERLRTARHEAGHALLYWLAGWWASYVTIVSRGDHGGYMAPCAEEHETGGFSKSQLLARIRMMLGGRGAELLHYGEEGLTTGASSDLQRATHLARRLVCTYGMDDEFGPIGMPELLERPEAISSELYQQVSDAARRILRDQMDAALADLNTHKQLLEQLVELLMRKDRATGEEIKQIFPAIPEIGRPHRGA